MGDHMEQKIINKLIKLIDKASKQDEVPVAAILTMNNKIISTYYNRREKNNNIINHAEILCILKAAKKLKTWKLDNCTLYVTLEPCSMCKKVIQESRIKNVYYFLEKPENKKEYNNTIYTKLEDKTTVEIIKNKMQNFFINKRK